ncbi:Peptidoglycan-binding Lysin subgroup [Penicillium taxi]|uniref:Peptidoglycan-binding Lysin subgroup n=1 Tax=Penicillium taxi TaxID=168475 RepID=UPI0025459847|nr:Peptidoglycan-binding Lysin subgroup [Penicillium taxi]KAJ5884953.1 Peptidoglycan-binding Lysin subgroup [Penicillium taxi]
MEFNPDTIFTPSKPVCCSWGPMPHFPPKVENNGICYKYTIEGTGDTCQRIADVYGITVDEIQQYNDKSYGWAGCDNLVQGDFICLSPGEPMMPVALPQATCGPQVPQAIRPSNWGDVSSMFPCALGKTDTKCSSGKCIQPTATTTATKRATTLTKATKVAAITTASAPKPTFSLSSISDSWMIRIFDSTDCTGDFYFVEGRNNHIDESKCLNLHGGLSPNAGDDVSCTWWTKDGTESTYCDASSLNSPGSFYLSQAHCNVFKKADCSDRVLIGYDYTIQKGCHSAEQVNAWSALMCGIKA